MLELILWIIGFLALSFANSFAEGYVEARLKSGNYSKAFSIGSCVGMLALFAARISVLNEGFWSSLKLAGVTLTREELRQYLSDHFAVVIIVTTLCVLYAYITSDANEHFDRRRKLRQSNASSK